VDRNYFAVEKGAFRDGYHQYPDVDGQTLPKTEGQKLWGKKSADRLDTSLDLEAAVNAWKRNLKAGSGKKSKTKGKKGLGEADVADVRLSDDVGDYVCGLVYYTALAEMAKRGSLNAVFLHVPPCPGDADVEKGKEVVIALIMALVEVVQ
jgi:hypothetical protein